MIAYVTVFYHNVSVFVIMHSQYLPKYYFYMFTASLLNYQYLASYPMANTTLTNIVYFCFALYQLSHYLFKFGLHLEHLFVALAAGNLSAILSQEIQSRLQDVHVR